MTATGLVSCYSAIELCACFMAVRLLNPDCKVAVELYFWLEETNDLICVAIQGRIRRSMSNTAHPQDMA